MTDPAMPPKPTPSASTPGTLEPSPVPSDSSATAQPDLPKEIGGAKGPEPTRYGDWQHKGRVTDF